MSFYGIIKILSLFLFEIKQKRYTYLYIGVPFCNNKK